WMDDRTDSPWYPEVLRLFRQSQPEAWEEVVERLTRELLQTGAEWHRSRGRPELALSCYCTLGVLLSEWNRPSEAEAAYRLALSLHPEHVDALYNLATLLHGQMRLEAAEAFYLEALRLRPDHGEALNNLGVLLAERKQCAAAEAMLRHAVALHPDHADAFNNLGELLRDLLRDEEAEATLGEALRLKPGHANARWNLGVLYLLQGRLAEGWPLLEARYHPDKGRHRTRPMEAPFPMWRGEDLTGHSLLIIPEQGFGDQIQFCRYAPLLKARGLSRLSVLCLPPLTPLLASLSGLDQVLEGEVGSLTTFPAHDFWIFPMSLPGLLGTTLATIPATLPYLSPPVERMTHWATRLPSAGLRVGLVWKGNAGHHNDANRSLPTLTLLAPLWQVPGILFISLQMGNGAEELHPPPAGQPLLHLGEALRDFGDTAAIVAQLDLVICIDSAIAHLTGALGKPCWVLLPAWNTDWRWLRERGDSPWYPGVMRLFRQSRDGEWSEVVGAVTGALTGVVHDRAVALYGQGKLAEALALVAPLPPNPESLNLAGICLVRLGELEQAGRCWRQAVDMAPDCAEVLRNLGNLHLMQREYAAAETAFRHALRVEPGHAEAHYTLGNILFAQHRFREAEEAYREALRVGPDHASAWSNLGNLLCARRALAEGEAAYRQAVRLQPDHGDAHYNLGVLLAEQNRMESAADAYLQTLRVQPDHANAQWNLGLWYLATGRFAEGWPL
ncbi:MAG: tetratricopeptide repeat protein, partial [Magnetococcales bacterium]|nr:tetratricopeptide repeat protein [Magnetococcales bacterium]